MGMLGYDLRQALRALARRPGLAVAVLLILALGIGSTTTISSVVSSALLARLPYRDGDRLVAIRTRLERDGSTFPSSWLDAAAWRERSRTLDRIAVSSVGIQVNLSADNRAERVGAGFVSASYFDLLGVRAALGRTFEPADENRASPLRVAVLRHGLWQRRFGSDPAIVGKSVQLQGLTFQVVGVLPRSFEDLYTGVDLYVPVTAARLTHRPGYVDDRAVRWLDVVARRRPGVGLDQAGAEMRAICRQLALAFPEADQGYTAAVQPLRTAQFDFDSMRTSLLTLLVGSVLLLLVGCANVTNLLLIRAVERQKEVALRLAMGVTPFRLVRHFVLEGALLAAGGGALGVAAALAAVRLLARLGTAAYSLPPFVHFTVDPRALGAAVALALLVSLLIGIVPARRSLQVDLQAALQSLGKGHTAAAGAVFTRRLLGVSAILFAVVLLVGTGLMVKTLLALMASDPGFRVTHLLSARFELPPARYQTDAPVYQLYQRVLQQARALPDVEEAGLWAPGMLGYGLFYQFIVPEGRPLDAQEEKIKVYEHRTSPGLLQALGFTLLRGRDFTAVDDARAARIGILSRSAAETAWPSQDPIGRRFWIGPPQNRWIRVVGVVADVDQHGRLQPDHDFKRDIYLPLLQVRSRTASILVRTRQEQAATHRALAQIMQAIDPDIPVFAVKTLAQLRREEEAGVRLNTFLLIFFAAAALALAIVGIYSVLLYTVRQQSFEIGIRMALGADPPHVLRHYLRQGLTLLALGVAAGLACALGLARAMASILFDVNPYDPVVFLAGAGLIALFTLPAILHPACKATRTDPSTLFRRH
jgi:putative ABC transport system permease protein